MSEKRLPTKQEAIVFAFKASCLRLKRHGDNLLRPIPKLTAGPVDDFPIVAAESRTPLYSQEDARELRLELGKVHNLRIAAKARNNLIIPKDQVFSFWRHLGSPTKGKGYVEGRQIQEGCVIPAIAGGICQLSNALYDAALQARLKIEERHGHTRELPRSSWACGRDATVAWNYVDLRFRPKTDTLLTVKLTESELIVQLRTKDQPKQQLTQVPISGPAVRRANTCETCGQEECFRHCDPVGKPSEVKTAALVDAFWPEYDEWIEADSLLCPLPPSNHRPQRYGWTTAGLEHSTHAPHVVVRRSLASRRLAEQGAARQMANLKFDRELALAYAKSIPFEARHLIIQQNLLPYLWQEGELGGRTFDVLMTRWPISQLQEILDSALAGHPDRQLLGDFRADPELLSLEDAALAAATRIVTPHTALAAHFGGGAELLDWEMPPSRDIIPGDRIAFAGPTTARKGAYEVREAARELGLNLRLTGSCLEGGDFWDGVDVDRNPEDWFDGCRAVVQPALLEDQPRKLLQALAAGLPVLATAACGLPDHPLLTTIDPTTASLTQAIKRLEEPKSSQP